MKKYKFLDHTADIKVEVWGETLEEAFRNAGIAFYDIILDVEKAEKEEKRRIAVEGFDLESLLFNWIDKLIFLFEVEMQVYKDFDIRISKIQDIYRLNAVGYGEKYNRGKHDYKVHVKAMTYHEMEILKLDGKYIIRFIVDI